MAERSVQVTARSAASVRSRAPRAGRPQGPRAVGLLVRSAAATARRQLAPAPRMLLIVTGPNPPVQLRLGVRPRLAVPPRPGGLAGPTPELTGLIPRHVPALASKVRTVRIAPSRGPLPPAAAPLLGAARPRRGRSVAGPGTGTGRGIRRPRLPPAPLRAPPTGAVPHAQVVPRRAVPRVEVVRRVIAGHLAPAVPVTRSAPRVQAVPKARTGTAAAVPRATRRARTAPTAPAAGPNPGRVELVLETGAGKPDGRPDGTAGDPTHDLVHVPSHALSHGHRQSTQGLRFRTGPSRTCSRTPYGTSCPHWPTPMPPPWPVTW